MEMWVKLRAALDELEAQVGYDQLDRISRRLLEWIAMRRKNDAVLYIQEIVLKSNVASPATVHKSLYTLEQHGLVSINIDAHDSRRRIVSITASAEKLLTKLSKGVEAWAKSAAKELT